MKSNCLTYEHKTLKYWNMTVPQPSNGSTAKPTGIKVVIVGAGTKVPPMSLIDKSDNKKDSVA
jgi:hypothetical protein